MSAITRYAGKTVRAGALATAALFSMHAQAAERNAFTLTVYDNVTGAQSLLAGDYDSAIRKTAARRRTQSLYPSMASTNLCVAHVMTGNLAGARPACDAAIEEAKAEKSTAPAWRQVSRKKQNDYIAIAYVNRAVLHYLSRDMKAAADDLAAAQRLAPKASFVIDNLTALDSSGRTESHLAIAR